MRRMFWMYSMPRGPEQAATTAGGGILDQVANALAGRPMGTLCLTTRQTYDEDKAFSQPEPLST